MTDPAEDDEPSTSPLMEALVERQQALEAALADNPAWRDLFAINYLIEREYFRLAEADVDDDHVETHGYPKTIDDLNADAFGVTVPKSVPVTRQNSVFRANGSQLD